MKTACLTQEQIDAFEANGFLHLKGVIDPKELESLRQAEERLTAPALKTIVPSQDYTYRHDPKTGKRVLSRIDYVQTKGDAFLKLFGNPALLRIAESIQGRNVLPGGFALVVKTPGFGAAVPWHRDPAYCRVRHGVNMGVYLDDANEDNGMLYVLPGSHKRSDIEIEALIEEHGFKIPGAIPVHARAGDVVVHSENVFHGSRTVRSTSKRRVIYYGCRTTEEQLARGLNADWVRAVAKVLFVALRLRAESEEGRGESAYQWRPLSPEYLPQLEANEFVEMRLREAL
jgi:ectoine hydroxylase-related dioxygenase (phytanoyl-CoA dioxygenase family)